MTPKESLLPRRELLVRYNHGFNHLTFLDYAFGPGPYIDVAQNVTEHRLSRATAAEIASLVCAAFKTPNADHSISIIEKLKKGGHIYGCTGLLHISEHGAYVEDNPSLLEGGRSIVMKSNLLEERLVIPGKRDGRVRFAPKDKTGEVSSSMIAHNALVVNVWGPEAGDNFAKLARDHKIRFYISSMDSNGKYFLKAKTHPNRMVRVAAMSMPNDGTIVLHADCPYDHQDIRGYTYGVDRKEIIPM